MARPLLPKELVKNKELNIRITKQEKKELKEFCKNQKITIAKFCRDAIFFQYKIKIK